MNNAPLNLLHYYTSGAVECGEAQPIVEIPAESKTMKVHFEVTDTFGGEANYSWVRRETIELPEKTSNLAIVRRAKAFAGFTGMRCDVSNHGDTVDIKPRGMCQILFVTFGDSV